MAIKSGFTTDYFALPIGYDPIKKNPVYMVYEKKTYDTESETRPIGTVTIELGAGSVVIQEHISSMWTPIDVRYKGKEEVVVRLIENVKSYATSVSKLGKDPSFHPISIFRTTVSAILKEIPRAYTSSVMGVSLINGYTDIPITSSGVVNLVTDIKTTPPSSTVSASVQTEIKLTGAVSTMLIKTI